MDALLLDFDGVLADSEPHFMATWNEALSPWGVSIPEEEYYLFWTNFGEGLEGHFLRCPAAGVDPQRARERQRELYRERCESGRIGLVRGAGDLLSSLGRGPFAGRAAIASNTDAEVVRTILRSAGGPGLDTILPVIGGAGLLPKPEPDIFLAAAGSLGARPEGTLVVEDSWKGLEAARRGGFRSVLVRTPQNAGLVLRADMTAADLFALSELLEVEAQP
jgi:beta-phosphoglucomutase-like phosphatase (HAD superfamily)